jgi:hypothetical protein
MTTITSDHTTDPLHGFSPSEIVVGPAGQTLAQAQAARPRIRTLSLRTDSLAAARRAMYAAVRPFGSLTCEIADLAIEYLAAGPARTGYGADCAEGPSCSLDAGIALLRETRAVDGEWSEVLLGGSRVQLITPTSGTVIELRNHAGRSWKLTVDFGAQGSDHRADQVLEHDVAAPDLAWQVTPVGSSLTRVRVSNRHAERIGWHLRSISRSWTVVESTGDHVEDTSVCETDATRDEVVAALDASVAVVGDACREIDWLSARRIGDSGEIRCGDLMGPHDGVRLCGACSTMSGDERTIPCGELIETRTAR